MSSSRIGSEEVGSAFRLAILIAGVGLWGWFIWQVSAYYAERASNAAYNAGQYAENADSRIARVCAGLTGANLTKCVSEQVAASREYQRAEYDLQAQQDSADAAFWMMVFGGATLFFSVVALWFVKGTLDATRDAVEDTGEATREMVRSNEIAEKTAKATLAAQRPLIQLDRSSLIARARPDESTYHQTGIGPVTGIHLEFHLRNYGTLPCWIEGVWFGFHVTLTHSGVPSLPEGLRVQFFDLKSGFVPSGEAVKAGGCTYGLTPEAQGLMSNSRGGGNVYLYGFTQYRSPSRELFCSSFAYQIYVGANVETNEIYPVREPAYWRDGPIKKPKLTLEDQLEYEEG